MRILFFAKYLLPPIGGAEISLLTLAKELVKRNEVFIVCQGEKERNFDWHGISVHQKNIWIDTGISYLRSIVGLKKWQKAIKSEIKNIRPDLILTQLTFAPLGVTSAKRFRIPVILFIRSYEHFCHKGFTDGVDCSRKCYECLPNWKEKIRYPLLKKKLEWHKFALKKADKIISNSYFVSELCKKWCNVESEVVPPFINLDDYISIGDRSLRNNLTYVYPRKRKGKDIFLRIARALNKENFLVVGRMDEDEEKLKSIRNVKYISYTDNMKDVYAKTKILLVPSIWPEPFARVCVEAMVNGIPCIVSKRGGLPEVVGDAGIIIDNPYNIDSWVKAIKEFKNNELYHKLSMKSEEQAKKFGFEHSYQKFIESLASIFPKKYKEQAVSK